MRTTPWFTRSPRLRRIAAAALAADLGLGVVFAAMAVSAGAAGAAPGTASASATSSAVTVRWTDGRKALDPDYVDDTQLDPGDKDQPLFRDLQVTVSQTQDLTDQGLQVSWSGGRATSPGGAASNFLQIMQCWAGPGAAGPSPEQCQWGTPNATVSQLTGTATATRDLLGGSEADPKQDAGAAYTHAPFASVASNLVPFWSVDDPRKAELGWTNDPDAQPPYGAAQSNEVTYARTALDGTGRYIVNLQSALSAPYLGCGNPSLAHAGYSCWLVVVPRGEHNLNGALAEEHDDSLPQRPQFVAGSPLSASAWQDRIQVRLTFSPIGATCRLGANEVPTAGSELVASAFKSWQSALCAGGKARAGLASSIGGGPGLEFVTKPADPATLGDAKVEYAPVATSGLVISYLIDKSYTDNGDNPDKGANGTLVTNLRLTPLLVAKLLTQSYRVDIPGKGEGSHVRKDNPYSLRTDPEFLQLNKDFKYFYNNESIAPEGLIVPFGDSDAAQAVWAWLRSDSAARSFLAGEPDNWGMTINPAYLDLGLDTDTTLASFPKADPTMYQTGDAPKPGYGTLDLRPYAASFTDAGNRTVTANAGSKILWDLSKVPAQYSATGSQTPGSRFELAITTAQAASLYGLPVASIVSDAGSTAAGVAPTADAMDKQLAKRVATDVPGVYAVDPMKTAAGGYPLTQQTYAAVNICAATKAELTAYAKLLDYVGSSGQVPGARPGQLPLGYAPLGEADKQQTRSVAADLRAEVEKPQCDSHRAGGGSSPTPTPTPTPPSTTTTPPSSTTQPPPSGPGGGLGAVPPVSGAPGTAAPSAVVDASALGVTPVAHVSAAARYALVAALLFALPCLIGGPSIIQGARRRR